MTPASRRDATTIGRPGLTKILATIGPASDSPDIVERLIEAGVGIFRLNFSHGTMEEHAARLATIRRIAERLGLPIAVLGDLQGPKIRVGRVAGDGIDVPSGATVVFQREAIVATPPSGGQPFRFSSTYQSLVADVDSGQRLLVNDGAVRMLIVDRTDAEITCAVTHGGLITSGKGINLPDSALSVSVMSARDWAHVDWAIEHEVDFLALSFVSCADEVRMLIDGIAGRCADRGLPMMRLPVIAKIERPAAVRNIESIVDAADGIMIARGDLGVEMDLAIVPVIQKRLSDIAQEFGKPCIVATQMLQSMIESPVPTRAEATDVANAIFQGADAVMLSGETATGRYPVITVETMRRIAAQAEKYINEQPALASPPRRPIAERYRTAAIAHGVWTVAQDIGAQFVVVWSQQGGGARHLSQNNFNVPIIAVSTDDRALRRMQLLRGVIPVCMPLPESLAHFTNMIDAYLQAASWAERGEKCVIVAGGPIGRAGVTNSLAIHEIGNPDTGYARHGQSWV